MIQRFLQALRAWIEFFLWPVDEADPLRDRLRAAGSPVARQQRNDHRFPDGRCAAGEKGSPTAVLPAFQIRGTHLLKGKPLLQSNLLRSPYKGRGTWLQAMDRRVGVANA